LKHKEEDRGHPGAYAGLAKAEFDESVNAPKQAGSILAGSVSESAVRTIRQIGSELREALAPTHHARRERSGGPMLPGRSMVRRRPHGCGAGRAAADAACSRGGPTQGIAPAASVPCIREC